MRTYPPFAVWYLFTIVLMASFESTASGDEGAGGDGADLHVHEISSRYQQGVTKVRVLTPRGLSNDEAHGRYAVIYLLPVEARDESRYGDGLAEVRKLGLHEKHGVIFVAPTFSHLPWYCDHPTNKEIRQESYFIEDVLTLVESKYPVKKRRAGRLLLGFSKSGWGAWSLLLRHPDLFERAAAWDAPLTMSAPSRYGMGPIFGTQANFQKYEITTLLEQRAGTLGGGNLPAPGQSSDSRGPRLIHMGYGNFRDHHLAIEKKLEALGVPRLYRDGPKRMHHWHGGWVAEAVELLLVKGQ